MFPQTDTASLLARASIAQFVGVQLRGNPHAEQYGPCPRCGGDDRFHIRQYQGRDYFFCRKCHPERGDAIEFLRWLHGVSFAESVQILGGNPPVHIKTRLRSSAPIPKTPTYKMPPPADWQKRAVAVIDECHHAIFEPKAAKIRAYLHGRGITDDHIRQYRLGYCATGHENIYARTIADHYIPRGIIVPTIVNGDVWQIRVRLVNGIPFPCSRCKQILTQTGECPHCHAKNKYRGVTGGLQGLMNADRVQPGDTVIFCAGEFDAILAQAHAPSGVTCVSFGSETTGLDQRWQIALRPAHDILVCYDNDLEGDRGFERIRATLPRAQRVRVPVGKDIGDFFAAAPHDFADWLAEVAGKDDPLTSFESAVLAWLETTGYTPQIGPSGQIIALKN